MTMFFLPFVNICYDLGTYNIFFGLSSICCSFILNLLVHGLIDMDKYFVDYSVLLYRDKVIK